jgi:hypothetical protein
MALVFEDVAKEIIREAISNALFVDDKALEPFKGRSKLAHLKDDHDRSKALYKDFMGNDCLLQVTKFSKASWNRNKAFNLNNKDLLILDWQLIGDEHEESLKILDESVIKKGLHFCCIYTQAALQEVRNELNRYYWGNVSAEVIASTRQLLHGTDLDDYWTINNQHPDWTEFDELANNIVNARLADIEAQVTAFKDRYHLSDQQIGSLKTIDALYGTRSSFIKLKTVLNQAPGKFSKTSQHGLTYRLSELDDTTIYINHTIVKLFQKGQVNGSQLYDSFVQSIIGEENVFLNLMGLEMRSRFRENSAFVGKDLDNVSEEAFFHHRVKNAETMHIFEDFLREILKDQVASFLYEKDLKIFNSLDDYFVKKGIQAKIDELLKTENSEKFRKQSFKLNKFYNLYNLGARKINDSLRFGDILKGTVKKDIKGTETEVVRYFLCITALCDCLRPKKINNQFWFVEGDILTNQNKATEKTDGKFLSFLIKENDVVAVDWENNNEFCIPFAMHIFENNITDGIKAQYYQQTVQLEWVASLKENYAQRIANDAFGYPLRVGIDFVKKK